MTDKTRYLIICWLAICSAMVFSMVLLGGAVRLTGSGLSMVDWKPLMGILPPIDKQSWLSAFEQYKQFPEYQQVNYQINLNQFKFIYLMEYSHRMLGRIIGLVFLVPFLGFLAFGKLDNSLPPRLWLLFFLGAVQGIIGWYMVKSGLVDNPAVSQYRLTLHLVVAVVIYAYMIRCLFGMTIKIPVNLRRSGCLSLVYLNLLLVLLMIISGGFMAGTHAGFIYNTFPTMGGVWIPDQLLMIDPFWKNLFENPITIQFVHRSLALIIAGMILILIGKLYKAGGRQEKVMALILLGALCLQITLGIFTLVLKVPVILGVTHQGGALILLTTLLYLLSSPFEFLVKPEA